MRSLRLAVLTIATALVLVPALARAHQQIEHRDATRLSIKHSWLGVAPPTKASLAPVAVAVLPTPAADITPADTIARQIAPDVISAPHVVLASSDPLRGPPSLAL